MLLLDLGLPIFSSLADAINVIALSNARRSELEKDLDEARLQLREAKAVSKDFNAGRLFRLEIENAELQRDLGLHKVALEEARQTVLSNIQKANVDLPLQIESLRRDLATAEAALQCAETARDFSVQELQAFRLLFSCSNVVSQAGQRSVLKDDVATAGLPSGAIDVACSSDGCKFPMISSVFKAARKRPTSIMHSQGSDHS